MRLFFVFCTIAFFAFTSTLQAEPPKEVRDLIRSHSQQIAEIEKQYQADLDSLLTKYQEKEDTETVNLLTRLKEEANPSANATAPIRYWTWQSGGDLVLKSNGEAYHTEWTRGGNWSLYDDGSIRLSGPTGVFRITFEDGVGHVLHLAKGGTTTIVPKEPGA